eukprot:5781-Heterococcus_DN1.PRE.3
MSDAAVSLVSALLMLLQSTSLYAGALCATLHLHHCTTFQLLPLLLHTAVFSTYSCRASVFDKLCNATWCEQSRFIYCSCTCTLAVPPSQQASSMCSALATNSSIAIC